MRGCEITLNYEALLHNLSIIKSQAPHSRVVAMVKGNAYGHGLVETAKKLDPHVAYLGVACLSEGIQLRNAGISSKILLLEGFLSQEEIEDIISHQLSIVLHHPWQVEVLLALDLSVSLDVWLKYDSGMHRLGLTPKQFKTALNQLSLCAWVADDIKLMTHFACAEQADKSHTNSQYALFESLRSEWPSLSVSAANSAAIFNHPNTHYQFIRPGIALYGSSPFMEKSANDLGLKAVMTFSSKIIALRDCQAGETVGYGATYHCDGLKTIATVAAGYGDGYPRHITNEAFVMIAGVACPIVGRVSMDMLTVDVSNLAFPYIEQPVILWGEALPIDTVASFSNTISYDLLCRVGLQIHR